MDRTTVIVAFGDVSGFNDWIRRGSNSPEVIQEFLERFYRKLEDFVKSHTDYHIKYLGDGFMAIKELSAKCTEGECAFNFVHDVATLTKKLAKIVKASEFPPPDGFRTRIAYGHVSKIAVLDPFDVARKNSQWEYVGYAINMAQKLLHVKPKTLLMLHESATQALGRKATRLRLRKVVATEERNISIDKVDLQELWTGEL
jgi:class 3 adenylate cyclase